MYYKYCSVLYFVYGIFHRVHIFSGRPIFNWSTRVHPLSKGRAKTADDGPTLLVRYIIYYCCVVGLI